MRDSRKPASIAVSLVLAAGAVVAAIAMVLWNLTRNGLWVDEMYSLHAIEMPFREMCMYRIQRGHFPTYFLMLKGVVEAMGGPTEVSLRVLSVVCWVLGIGLFIPLAFRMLERHAALIAITLFSLNGLALRQAVEARMYTLVLLLAVLLAHAYLRLVAGEVRRRWNVALIVFSVFGLWVSASFFLLLLALLYDAWRRRRENFGLLKWMIWSVLIAAATLLPLAVLHVSTARQNEIAGTKAYNILVHLVTFVTGVAGNDDYYESNTLLFWEQCIGGVLAVSLLAALWQRRRGLLPVEAACSRILLFPIILMFVSWLADQITGLHLSLLGPGRYLMGLAPFGALLAGALIAGNLPTVSVSICHVLVTAFLAFAGSTILTIQTEPFREMLARLKTDYEPGDGLIVVPGEIVEGVSLYLPNAHIDAAFSRWQGDNAQMEQDLNALKSRRTVWLIWYRGGESQAMKVAEQILGPAQSSSLSKKYGKMRFFRFDPLEHKPEKDGAT
ncbi:MAG: hypothetical protein K1X53_00485 [Candidatus Sumerlaeaceae bacterium]|nr:hypothetical protein [Candidatus Sumerlaeaceae bacterium]